MCFKTSNLIIIQVTKILSCHRRHISIRFPAHIKHKANIKASNQDNIPNFNFVLYFLHKNKCSRVWDIDHPQAKADQHAVSIERQSSILWLSHDIRVLKEQVCDETHPFVVCFEWIHNHMLRTNSRVWVRGLSCTIWIDLGIWRVMLHDLRTRRLVIKITRLSWLLLKCSLRLHWIQQGSLLKLLLIVRRVNRSYLVLQL